MLCKARRISTVCLALKANIKAVTDKVFALSVHLEPFQVQKEQQRVLIAEKVNML